MKLTVSDPTNRKYGCAEKGGAFPKTKKNDK